jgi:hypothetical protein
MFDFHFSKGLVGGISEPQSETTLSEMKTDTGAAIIFQNCSPDPVERDPGALTFVFRSSRLNFQYLTLGISFRILFLLVIHVIPKCALQHNAAHVSKSSVDDCVDVLVCCLCLRLSLITINTVTVESFLPTG